MELQKTLMGLDVSCLNLQMEQKLRLYDSARGCAVCLKFSIISLTLTDR